MGPARGGRAGREDDLGLRAARRVVAAARLRERRLAARGVPRARGQLDQGAAGELQLEAHVDQRRGVGSGFRRRRRRRQGGDAHDLDAGDVQGLLRDGTKEH